MHGFIAFAGSPIHFSIVVKKMCNLSIWTHSVFKTIIWKYIPANKIAQTHTYISVCVHARACAYTKSHCGDVNVRYV
jgi:hypothetical protein